MQTSLKKPNFQTRTLNGPSVMMQRMIIIVAALLIKLALNIDFINDTEGLIINTIILISYLVVESCNLWQYNSRLFFINPIFLASISTIALPYGFSNIVYLIPEHFFYGIRGVQVDVTTWMNQVLFLVMIGSYAMWIGYSSSVSSHIWIKLQHSKKKLKWSKQSSHLSLTNCYFIAGIAIASRIISVKLGLFGFISGDLDTFQNTTVTTAGYSQYLTIASNLYRYVLIAMSLKIFSLSRPNQSLVLRFIILLIIELFFCLLSGSKGPIVFTLILIGQIFYSQHNRFPTFLIPIILLSLIIAYSLIEPYRQIMITNKTRANDLAEISTLMFTSEDKDIDVEQKPSTILKILDRISMTSSAAFGIEYAAVNEKLPSDSPDFLGNMLMAPIYAFVPRFLMSNKPLGDLGLWYTREVIGSSNFVYVSMGPFTYLNFAGGYFAIFSCFFIIGILQRILFEVFTHFGNRGFFIYFSFLGIFTDINFAINAMIIEIVRSIPIVMIVMFFLLKQRPSITR